MKHHLNDPETHTAERRNKRLYTSSQLFTKGHVQRFFTTITGSSYFRVDPLLSGVQKDSDFDIFFASVQSEGGAPSEEDANRSIEEPWDISPYLARTGWIDHLKGYSWSSMVMAVGRLHGDEPELLQNLPQVAELYFKSVSAADVVRLVHPSNLSRLSHWKR
jgi:hypothetical protein